jgi:hypothetical protein
MKIHFCFNQELHDRATLGPNDNALNGYNRIPTLSLFKTQKKEEKYNKQNH